MKLFSRSRRERGAVLIYVAILALILIGLVGLAMDGAWVLNTSQQLQHAADAAALNSVRYVDKDADPFPQLRNAAVQVALANAAAMSDVNLDTNAGNAVDGDIVVGFWDTAAQTFTPYPTAPDPNAVRVNAHRTSTNADGPLSLFFGPVFGKQTSDVGVTATAVWGLALPPLILILDTTKNDPLEINGTNIMNVPNGRVHANYAGDPAIHVFGTSALFALRTTACGTISGAGNITGGPVVEHQPPVADPLANVLPTAADWDAFKASMGPSKGTISAAGAYAPGYYAGGIDANNVNVVLNAGSYMLGGKGITLHGNANVSGTGVTLFIDKNADIDVGGSGAGMQLSAPPTGQPYFGITIFTHRETSPSTVFKIGGGGSYLTEGVTYVPSGILEIAGNPGKTFGAIIAWRLTNKGTTGFTVTGSGIPPLSTEKFAYLVE